MAPMVIVDGACASPEAFPVTKTGRITVYMRPNV